MQSVCFFNNCRSYDHVQAYGKRAFFDLKNSGRQAKQARDLLPGQLCAVGSYGDGGQVIFRWYSFSNEAWNADKRRRVFFGRFLASETLPKRRAVRSAQYSVLFKRTGDFKQGSVFRRELRVADLPVGRGTRQSKMHGMSAASRRVVGGGFGNPVENSMVEAAAMRAVAAWYRTRGWGVKRRDRDRCGFDLQCSKDDVIEDVEVKGVRSSEPSFIITAGELKQANRNPRFVLRIVTSALSSSATITRYSGPVFRRRFRLSAIQYRAALKS